jgi:hypothetical protein
MGHLAAQAITKELDIVSPSEQHGRHEKDSSADGVADNRLLLPPKGPCNRQG